MQGRRVQELGQAAVMMMCQGGEPVRSAMSAVAVMSSDVLL